MGGDQWGQRFPWGLGGGALGATGGVLGGGGEAHT